MVNVAVVSALLILSLAIILLNSGCLFMLLSSEKRRRISSLLLASLLIIHIIQGVVVIPLYTAKRWKISNKTAKVAVCDSFRFSYLLTNYISCITILLISLDRFCAIRFPLKYRVRASAATAVKSIAASWTYVIALCLIPFRNHCGKCNYSPSTIWSVSMLSVNTFLPFLIIIFIYTYISRKSFIFVRRSERRRCIQKREKLPNARRKSAVSLATFLSKEFAAAKVAVLITASYIVCWGPSFMYYMLKNTCKSCFAPSFKDSSLEEKLDYAMKFLTLVDGLAAPIIYCLRNASLYKNRRMPFNSLVSRSTIKDRSASSTVKLALDSVSSETHTQRFSFREGRATQTDTASSIPDKGDLSADDQDNISDATDQRRAWFMISERDGHKRWGKNGALDDDGFTTLTGVLQEKESKGRGADEILMQSLDGIKNRNPSSDSLKEKEAHAIPTDREVDSKDVKTSRWIPPENDMEGSGSTRSSSCSVSQQKETGNLRDEAQPLLRT